MAGRIVKQRKQPKALLRKLTQPLYDTNIVPAVGDGAYNLLQYFLIPIGQNMPLTGAPKTEADTNLTQASQLGTPQKFHLEGFNFEFFVLDPDDTQDTAADLIDIYEQSVFTFYFSNNRPWLQLPLSRIPTGTALTGTCASGDTTNAIEFAFLHQGEASVREVYDFTVGKKPIRIGTAEPFFAEITWPNGAVTSTSADRRRSRVFAVGSLFSAL